MYPPFLVPRLGGPRVVLKQKKKKHHMNHRTFSIFLTFYDTPTGALCPHSGVITGFYFRWKFNANFARENWPSHAAGSFGRNFWIPLRSRFIAYPCTPPAFEYFTRECRPVGIIDFQFARRFALFEKNQPNFFIPRAFCCYGFCLFVVVAVAC